MVVSLWPLNLLPNYLFNYAVQSTKRPLSERGITKCLKTITWLWLTQIKCYLQSFLISLMSDEHDKTAYWLIQGGCELSYYVQGKFVRKKIQNSWNFLKQTVKFWSIAVFEQNNWPWASLSMFWIVEQLPCVILRNISWQLPTRPTASSAKYRAMIFHAISLITVYNNVKTFHGDSLLGLVFKRLVVVSETVKNRGYDYSTWTFYRFRCVLFSKQSLVFHHPNSVS